MKTINVARHVFASLTKDQSPFQQGGYQTLFYTRNLITSAEFRAIEDRAKFLATQEERDKWQFFWLPSQKAVVSHFVSVPEPDEFGRKGRYLAHSIIVSSDDWRASDYSPFDLMNARDFFRTMAQALEAGDLRTGELAAIQWEFRPAVWFKKVQELAIQWSPNELCKLVRLVVQAQSITRERKFVAFIGNDQQIIEALSVAFLFAQHPRSHCSFDTSATGCTWPRDVNFWGHGFANERDARTLFIVDAAQRTVRLPPDWRPALSTYEQWLEGLVSDKRFVDILKDQGAVNSLCGLLEVHSAERDKISEVSDSLKSDFAKANQIQVERRIAGLFPVKFPPFLQQEVFGKIGYSAQEQLDWLIENPAGEDLGAILFEILGKWDNAPSLETVESMLPLVGQHYGLDLLLAIWLGEEEKIYHSLSAMTAEQYNTCMQDLGQRQTYQPWHFFSARHLETWFAIYKQKMTVNDITKGISLTVKHGNENEIVTLNGIANCLISIDQRKELAKWLKGQQFRKHLNALQSALEDTLQLESEPMTEKPVPSQRRLFKRSG